MRRIFAALALAAIVSCGGSTEPVATVNGTWTGVTGTQTFVMTIVSNSGAVTGSGTISSSSGPLATTIVGTYSPPIVTATLTSGLHPPINLVATVTGKSMTGSLNGSGFTGDAITLTRP